MEYKRIKRRVLIVEDSTFFVKRLVSILSSAEDIDIVGIADNGIDALAKIEDLKPDVITMDITMPLLDGIEVVRQTMKKNPTPIIMLSAQTDEGAEATFDALQAGAVDFLSKNVENFTFNVVIDKIRAVAGSKFIKDKSKVISESSEKDDAAKRYDLVLIGASTGGPITVEQILTKLPEKINFSILIVMHMPKDFVEHYAQRISSKINNTVTVLSASQILRSGVYIAPGGMNVRFKGNVCKVEEPGDNDIYMPNINIAMKTASKFYKDKLLGIILTGMGADGVEGAEAVKNNGGNIWGQDPETAVVSGMPSSLERSGFSDKTYNIDIIGNKLAGMT